MNNLPIFCYIVLISSCQLFLPTEVAVVFVVFVSFLVMLYVLLTPERGGGVVFSKDAGFVIWMIVYLIFGLVFSMDHELRDILRDFAFSLSVACVGFAGMLVARRGVTPFVVLNGLLFSALIHATHQLLLFFSDPKFFELDAVAVRGEIGSGVGSVVSFVLVVLCFRRKLFSQIFSASNFIYLFVVVVLFLSVLFSYSRTQLLYILLASSVMAGWLFASKLKTVILVCVLALGLIVLGAVTPDNETGTVRSKLLRSIAEVSLIDTYDEQEINDNWRGYESAMALNTLVSGGKLDILFGRGFGALVDMEIYILLGEDYLRYIPVLHNGYVYVLFKTGLVGLICYFMFFYSQIKGVRLNLRLGIGHNSSYLRVAMISILGVAIFAYVVHGVPQFSDLYLVLVSSYLFRYLRVSTKNVGGCVD